MYESIETIKQLRRELGLLMNESHSRKLLNSLVKNMPVAVVIFSSLDGSIISTNKLFAGIIGKKESEILGNRLLSFCYHKDLLRVSDAMNTAEKTEWEIGARVIHSTGNVWVRFVFRIEKSIILTGYNYVFVIPVTSVEEIKNLENAI